VPFEFLRVDEVAVVAEDDGTAVDDRPEHRLGVVPARRAGGGVAAVADRHVTVHRLEGLLVEDLTDQAEILVDQDLLTVRHGDPGGLLATVLECVQAVVGELGDVLAGGPHAEDAAFLDRADALGVDGQACGAGG